MRDGKTDSYFEVQAGESSKSNKHSPTYSSSPSSNLSSPSSPFFQRLRSSHDAEDDHSQNQKKSVLTKVKEKAKKLRHSLSKKKHEDGNLSSPSSATGAEGDGAEEEAEFLGAPSNIHHHTTPHSLFFTNICVFFLILKIFVSLLTLLTSQCTNQRRHP